MLQIVVAGVGWGVNGPIGGGLSHTLQTDLPLRQENGKLDHLITFCYNAQA